MNPHTLPTTRARRALQALARSLALALGALAGLSQAQSPLPAAAGATGLVIYPAKDQSPKQQDQDKYQCYEWARGQTGFDPAQASAQAPVPAMAAAPPPTTGSSSSGPSLSGMAKGAAGGAAVAELANRDVGHGAAAGVVGSTLIGKLKERQSQPSSQQQAQAQQQMQQMQQMQAARGQQRTAYDRAFGACLEGRGYVVK